MFAVYAFCREIDDIADEPAPLEAKKKALEQERLTVERQIREGLDIRNMKYLLPEMNAVVPLFSVGPIFCSSHITLPRS